MDISRDNPFSHKGNRFKTRKRLAVVATEENEVVKALVGMMRERGAEIELLGSTADVMVAVAGGEVEGVVLVEPKRLSYVAELIGALEKYRPEIMCWRYEEGEDGGRLEMYGSAATGSLQSKMIVLGEGVRNEPVTLKLGGQDVEQNSQKEDEEDSRVLVSLEELDMLLGPVDET